MMLRRLVTLSTLVFALSSCTGKDSEGEAKDAAAAEPSGPDMIEVPSREPAKIEVIDAGAEPRQTLRMRPKAGTEETLVLTIGMRMTMDSGAGSQTLPVPATKTTMLSAIEAADDAEIRANMTVKDVEVVAQPGTPPQVIEKVKETTEPLKKYEAKLRLSPRGHVLGGSVKIPRDLPAMVHNTMTQMTQSLGQISVPLPEPALGVGAKWTATYDIEQNGMKMRQLASYTLLSLADDVATLEVSISQELLDPNVNVPGMLGKARVSDFSSMGKGTTTIDLGKASPDSMLMTLDMSMTMDVTVLGQNQNMKMEMGIDMEMSRS